MARFVGAQWRPIVNNYTPGGMNRYQGVVLHIMQGTLNGTDAWFNNRAAGASAHFGVGKEGQAYQWVDTKDKAWAQAGGNPSWLSIELEGHTPDEMTPKQAETVARIVAWAAVTHSFPLQISDRPALQGVGWHGMGGAAWGNHTACPGESIKGQRSLIIERAVALTNPGDTVQPQFAPIALEPVVSWAPCPSGGAWLLAASGAVYAVAGAPFHGNVKDKPYFAGRKAAKVEPEIVEGKWTGFYTITSNDDKTYTPKEF